MTKLTMLECAKPVALGEYCIQDWSQSDRRKHSIAAGASGAGLQISFRVPVVRLGHLVFLLKTITMAFEYDDSARNRARIVREAEQATLRAMQKTERRRNA